MAEFSYELEVPVRFQDLDAAGQVNNVLYATYLEEARISYMKDVLGADPGDGGVVIAHLEVDYRRPITDDGQVTVTVRAENLGESSIPVVHEIRFDGEVVATAETVMVTTDPETGNPRPIPEAWRDRIETHEHGE